MNHPLETWLVFVAGARERLEGGGQARVDRPLSADPAARLDELEQQLLDVCGASFALWCQLEAARTALASAEEQCR